MKRVIFALGLTGCRLVSAASSAEDRALLYVTVRTTGDLRSQRLPEATVTIRTLREQVIATVRTDSNGRATLDLPVGIYDAIASATGFQNQTIHVEAFAGQAAIVFSLVPAPAMEPLSEREPAGFAHAAISGLVLTLQGEPVTNAVVTLTGPTYDETIVETAPDGSFRAVVSMPRSVGSQEYRLRIGPKHPAPDGHPPAVTIVTDYADVATPVSISPGFESKGVVLHVSSHPEFRLTVTVRDATGSVPPGTEVSASSTWTGSVRESHLSVFPVPPDGAVTFGSLRSGSVTIWALTKTTTPPLAAATRIVIGDRPPDDVFMLLLPSARLTGRVEFSDSDQPIRRAVPLRVLATVPGHALPGYKELDPDGVVGTDGSFALSGLVGERCLHLLGIPRDWSLTITMQGRDVTDEPLTFSAGADVSDLVLHVTPRGAKIVPRSVCATP